MGYKRENEVLNTFLMIMAMLFFAGSFIAGKFAILEIPLYTLIFLRFSIATLILFVVMKGLGKSVKIDKGEIPILTLLALLGIIIYHFYFFLALKHTSSTNTAIIAAINPIFTAILSLIFLKEKIGGKEGLGIVISLIGVYLIITKGSLEMLKTIEINIGDLYMLIAVLSYALFFIVLKKAQSRIETMTVTFYVFLISSILLLPLAIKENVVNTLRNLSYNGWSSLLYMSIFASVIGYVIQQRSVKEIGASKTSLYINLVPLFSMMLASIFLKEEINVIQLLAAVLVIIGVILNIKKPKKQPLYSRMN